MSDKKQEETETKYLKMNPDLAKERNNSDCDVELLKCFFGSLLYGSDERYKFIKNLKEEAIAQIEPNGYHVQNLDRNERYDISFKKCIQSFEFADKNNLTDANERIPLIGTILGTEKNLFALQHTMVRDSIELWGDEEQRNYWLPKLKDYSIICTYAQTELGHGTYVRGLETTATFDEKNDEFILNSPTITSYKFWPGSLGNTCNYAIVMARLIVSNVDHGIHAFLVQLRCTETHKRLPNIELGDIGTKYGFHNQDNGYAAFHNARIPRRNMLMNFFEVASDGKVRRKGSEIFMYVSMLLTRGSLAIFLSASLSAALTISIRYSCVRHQTANEAGIEPQILDYQTQQYRLFTALSVSYGLIFVGITFRKQLRLILEQTNKLKNASKEVLAQLHALSSANKAHGFDECLKYSQICRLCCGGHGYSASSGLTQIISDADAGCTYEGDNIVLYLQTARYLLKCADKNLSPHLVLNDFDEITKKDFYLNNKYIIEKYFHLYDALLSDVGGIIMKQIEQNKQTQLEAFSNSSVYLIDVAKVYAVLFNIASYLSCINYHTNNYKSDANKQILTDLFQIYVLYGLCDKYSGLFLKYEVINPGEVREFKAKLLALLPKIRKNAVVLVDAFDHPDSMLCSSLGSYDGNAYERLLEFARRSKFNEKDPVDQFEKYLKPFVQKQKSKL